MVLTIKADTHRIWLLPFWQKKGTLDDCRKRAVEFLHRHEGFDDGLQK